MSARDVTFILLALMCLNIGSCVNSLHLRDIKDKLDTLIEEVKKK